jgi:hypothetical protein
MRISRPSGCDDGAHRHSERGIHQMLSGLAETLATVHWLQRELLRRGQEALVVRLKFVFFTDSVSQLYGQRMYVLLSFRLLRKEIFTEIHIWPFHESYTKNARRKSCDSSCEVSINAAPITAISLRFTVDEILFGQYSSKNFSFPSVYFP